MKYFLFLGLLCSSPLMAFDMHLLDVRQGSTLSDKARDFEKVRYESADGNTISMNTFYRTNWTDMRILWLTPIHDSLGLIWGLSTGEYGKKYTIQPGITLGFTGYYNLSKNETLQWRIQGVVMGGQFKERACLANYGDIAGDQEVNCRLAASILSPQDTLQYLERTRPYRDNYIMVRFQKKF